MKFMPLQYENRATFRDLHQLKSGIKNDIEYHNAVALFGRCEIDIPMKTIPKILYDDIFNPFYVFQV
jgi:hypothetical protein